MMTRRLICLILLSAFVWQGMLKAQVTTGTITGLISGTSKSGLAGATITAVHQPSGTRYSVTTRRDGTFTMPNLRIGGPYTVTVTFIGLQTSTTEDIYLKLDEPYVLNASMSTTGSTLENVVVTGTNRSAVMNANRNGATTNVGTRELQRLPTISRSINDFTRLTPQASSSNSGAIGGGNYRQNYITVDGSDFNNTFGIGGNLPAGGSPISIDALQEISVNVTPYDVKQSGFIGSSINAVTRSGTNQFSGSVYTFWRGDAQQGNKVGPNTFTKQNLQVNTYGFRLGGPIIPNKLFFFINAESGKTTSPGQQNFASTSGRPYPTGGNNIARPSADSLRMISDYLKKTYGYETGPFEGYDFESKNTRLVARIDWNISSKHRLNVRYSQVESKSPSFPSTSRSPLPAFSQTRTSIYALPFKNAFYYQESNFYSLAGEVNSQFGKVANTFRASFTHQNDPRSSDSQVFPFVDILNNEGSTSTTLPYTSFGYESFSYGNLRDVKTLSFVEYATFSLGKHNFTLGGQADLQSTKNGFQRFGTSYYTFNSWNDFVNGALPRDFALTYSLLPNYEQAFPRFKFGQYSLYGQDEFVFSKKFRATLGLRADLLTYRDVKEIQEHKLVSGLSFMNGSKINTGELPNSKVMLSPRLGFNWDVKGDRTVQLRGGTGIFTGRVPTVWIVAQSGDAGLLQITQTWSGSAVPGPFSPDPNKYRPATQPTPGTTIPSAISAIHPDFKFPQAWKSSLAVDTKLPWGLTGTLEGIVNKDLNVALGKNYNLVNPTALNVAGYPDSRPIYPSTNSTRFINPLTSAGLPVANGAATGTGAFNAIVLDNAKKGYYWSVTARVDKQFSNGFLGTIAYTKSQAKNLYDGSGDQLINTWTLNPTSGNPNNQAMSYADYVVPDRLVISLSYRKEYLKHLATQVSLFYEGSIAGRFSYTYSADFNRDGQTNDLIYVPKDATEITFVDQTYGGVNYTAKQQSDLFFRYIDQDSYLSTRKGQYAERNGAKLPWRNQVDFRLAQDLFTSIGKKRNTLQFTWDVFNFGNLLNSNWGVFRSINNSAILVPRNQNSLVAGGTVKPTFSLASDRNVPITSTFRNNESLTSTYYMQFGLRYTFN